MFSTRAASTGAFDSDWQNNFVPDIDGDGDESKIWVSDDALSIVYASSDSSGTGGVDLWMASRGSDTGSFTGTETKLGAVDTNKDQTDPWLSPDGCRLYYADNTSGHQVIEVSARDSTSGNYGAAQALLEDPKGDADPTLSPDELVIVFSSNHTGKGDLYYATRAHVTDAFSTPVLVPTVNTPDSDGDPFLSADGCQLYFASNHTTNGDYDLFVATAHP